MAQILRALRPTLDVLCARAPADRIGLLRSTVHLLCRTLASEDLLETVTRAGYRLGPLVLEFGGIIINRTGRVDAVEGDTQQRGTDGVGDRERRASRPAAVSETACSPPSAGSTPDTT